MLSSQGLRLTGIQVLPSPAYLGDSFMLLVAYLRPSQDTPGGGASKDDSKAFVPRACTCVSLGHCHLVSISLQAVQDLVEQFPSLWRRFEEAQQAYDYEGVLTINVSWNPHELIAADGTRASDVCIVARERAGELTSIRAERAARW